MLLDIHVHTAKYSPCSSLDLYDAAIKARAVGLDGICITDHDTDAAKTEAARVVRETGLQIFVGMEVQTYEGDLLVFGLPEPPGMIMYAAALLAKVAAAGGTAIAAHPFRDNERGLGEYILQLPGLGGVEVLNGRTTKAGNARAQALAVKHKFARLGGSDAHHLEELGRYATFVPGLVADEKQFIQAVRDKRVRPVNLQQRNQVKSLP